MGSFDGMKEKADAKKKVLLWLFLIYLVVIVTFLIFAAPLLRNIIQKH